MSESERVQRWRQRQREAGKEPLTIWLTSAEKLRLEDQALSMRCSPSELVQRMLALWHGESQAVTDTVTDTEQLRAVTDAVTDTIRQELSLLVHLAVEELQLQRSLPVTDTVTDTILQGVTDTVTAMKTSPLSHAGNIDVTATVTDTQSIVTFTVTDTEEAIEAADVAATVTDTTTAPPAKRKAPPRQRAVTAPVSDPVTDTHIQAQDVTAAALETPLVIDTVTVTGTDTHGHPVPEGAMDHQGEHVTDTVTDASAQTEDERAESHTLPPVTDTVTDTQTAPAPRVADTVTDTESVTDTVTVAEPKHRGRKPVLREPILALLRFHTAGLTAAELKVYLKTEKHIGDTLAGMVKAQLLVKAGSGKAVRYQLAGTALAPSRP